jgi:hypothetical protein
VHIACNSSGGTFPTNATLLPDLLSLKPSRPKKKTKEKIQCNNKDPLNWVRKTEKEKKNPQCKQGSMTLGKLLKYKYKIQCNNKGSIKLGNHR